MAGLVFDKSEKSDLLAEISNVGTLNFTKIVPTFIRESLLPLSLKPGDSFKLLCIVFSQSDSFLLFECTVFAVLLTTVICTIDKTFIVALSVFFILGDALALPG